MDWIDMVLPIVMLMLVSRVQSACPSYLITTADVQLAWKASEFAYQDGSVNGALIPGTNFRIIAHGEDEVREGKTPVKVFVAEYGQTTIIAYRGTTTNGQLGDQLLESIRSLGGEKHAVWNSRESSLITFGQPRTGDGVYANKHDELIGTFRKLRFTNRNDPVNQLVIPLIPHAVHHSREIWMAKQIKWWWRRNPKPYWKVCDPKDAWNCSFQRITFPNVNDHMTDQYRKYIENIPSIFYDKNSKLHSTFHGALGKTCSRRK